MIAPGAHDCEEILEQRAGRATAHFERTLIVYSVPPPPRDEVVNRLFDTIHMSMGERQPENPERSVHARIIGCVAHAAAAEPAIR